MTEKSKNTYTVLEDQPNWDRWDVEVRTCRTLKAARRFMDRTYTTAQQGGDDDNCCPFIRNDRTGERV